MNVIFVEPAFPANQREFVRGLAAAGANVFGIGERPVEWLDRDLKSWMVDYLQVPSVVNENALERATRLAQSRMWIDRMEATVEAHIMATARVREKCGIPGVSVHTSYLCRDKPAMKEALRKAGVSTAQSTAASSGDEVRAFAERVGLPLILKPADAAGAAGTFKVTNAKELEHAIAESHVEHGARLAVEEFIEGHEGFLDTITIDGKVVHEFVTHYYPNVLEAMRTRWISPQMVATNRVESEGYNEVRAMARKVIAALDIGTSATHMEWFYGPKGLKFSEIGCRPPGVCQWDVYNAANEMDLYREWGMAIVHGRPAQKASRRFAGGMIALRPDRDGRIVAYEGIDEIGRRYGDCVVATHFPPPGSTAAPVAGGYMANAWMRLRHPNYDTLRGILTDVGETIKIRAR